jgi:hypothetical protein
MEEVRPSEVDVTRRLVVCSLLAVFVFGALALVALTLPAVCPGGFHPTVINGVDSLGCTSDATHIAPSSGVRIPVAGTLTRDPRVGLRIWIGLVGLFAAGGLVWAGLGGPSRTESHETDAAPLEDPATGS